MSKGVNNNTCCDSGTKSLSVYMQHLCNTDSATSVVLHWVVCTF